MSPSPTKEATGSTKRSWPLVEITISIVGAALCAYAIATANDAANINGQPHSIMVIGLISLFALFGMLLACTLELTVGMLGSELLALPWNRMSTVATFIFLAEIALAGWTIIKLKPDESIEMAAAPVMYAFSRIVLGYIAWCIPRRMVVLSKKNDLRGQASLALSGWIAVLCFLVAMGLPTAWPWSMLKL